MIHLLLCFIAFLSQLPTPSESLENQIILMSFVPVPQGSDFPLENLPYGIFSTPDNVSHSKSTI